MLDGLRYVKIYTIELFEKYFKNVTLTYPLEGVYPIVYIGEQTSTGYRASKFHHEKIVTQTVHIFNNDLTQEGSISNSINLVENHFYNIDVSNIIVTGFNRDIVVDESTDLQLTHHIIEIELKIR